MRNIRGIIVLIVAVVSGLVAAQLVSSQLHRTPQVPVVAPPPVEKPVKPEPTEKASVRLTDSIPMGKRAVSVQVDNVTGVAGNLHPGDIVDVVATTHDSGDDIRIARIILERVEILKINDGAEEKENSYSHKSAKWTVTLAVDPLQAAALRASESRGSVSLLARNPEDEQQAETRAALFTPEEGVRPYQRECSGYDLAALIPEGMRVFTIESRETDGVGGDIQPGDYIDVLLTCPYSQFSTGSGVSVGTEGKVTATRMASRILLQRVPVIAVRKKNNTLVTEAIALQEGSQRIVRGEESTLVSLLVTPEEAEQLTVANDASKKAFLRLVLRNPEDQARVDTSGVLLLDLLTERYEMSRVQVVRGNSLQERTFYEVGKGRNRLLAPKNDKDIGIEP